MSSEIGLNRIADVTLGAPARTIAAEGLSLDATGALRMILTLVNPTDAFVGYYLNFNDDLLNANYWRQFVAADDEARTSGRRNDPRLTGLDPGESAIIDIILARGPDGLARATVSVNRGAPAEVLTLEHKIVWTIVEDVTSIEVNADADGGIGPGSTLILYDPAAVRK